MKRETAEGIMVAMKHAEQALGELDIAIREVDDVTERRQMLRAMADTIHNLHLHISVQVAQRFPDLHPDGYSRTY